MRAGVRLASLARVKGAAAIALLAFAACRGADPHAPELERLKASIGDRRVAAAALPKHAADAEALERLTSALEIKAEREEDARLDWRLGECHRLRDALGKEGAWELAEQRYQLALARDPKMVDAHVSLGQLYLAGGFEYAPKAEAAFTRALEASTAPNAAARKGLFFAYYYQGRFADAVGEAARYEQIVGDDPDFEKFRAMAEANAARPHEVKK